jgi:hypothetical protein
MSTAPDQAQSVEGGTSIDAGSSASIGGDATLRENANSGQAQP